MGQIIITWAPDLDDQMQAVAEYMGFPNPQAAIASTLAQAVVNYEGQQAMLQGQQAAQAAVVKDVQVSDGDGAPAVSLAEWRNRSELGARK